LTLDEIKEIARIMRERSCARELSGVVREILGTCHSIGCMVEGRHPREVIEQIRSGEIMIENV
jgi:large subunit ribosomal protein L12e